MRTDWTLTLAFVLALSAKVGGKEGTGVLPGEFVSTSPVGPWFLESLVIGTLLFSASYD